MFFFYVNNVCFVFVCVIHIVCGSMKDEMHRADVSFQHKGSECESFQEMIFIHRPWK